ncbi:hypothetical protein IMSAGC019_00612 [Lachnospiraceae bacterium]|nr:hypothetical protein IMSAGC019_00612 [Lachnospiraceae bacterium]
MKKRILTKVITMAMACALVVGNTGLTVHAATDDGAYHGDDMADGGSSASDGSDDIGGGGNSGSSNSSSSNNSGSTDDGAYHGDGMGDGGSSASNGNDDIGSGNGGSSSTASYTAPKAAGKAASAGKETFRAVAKAGAGTYKVTHKGVEIATFSLMDSDKKAVSCTAVTLKQREDKKYAIDFQVDDATGLTVGAPLDRTYMYSTLGVSYVTINDEIIIDIESESAAKTTK